MGKVIKAELSKKKQEKVEVKKAATTPWSVLCG